jgi:HSP20 family protein
MAMLPSRRGGRALVTRAYPFREVEDVYHQMGQLLNNVFGDLNRVVEELPWIPQADIGETEDAYLVMVDLPGVNKKDIDIQVHDREVTVSGEVTRREGRWFRRSRPVGSFELRATVPGDIEPDGIDADLSEGVLRLTIPKAEKSKPRRVEITSSDGESASTSRSGAGSTNSD